MIIFIFYQVYDFDPYYFLCSGLTAIATYLLTSEIWSRGAGLFAACFIAIVPGYSSRSVAGSYDNEGIAIFALQFTYYLWLKSVKSGSIFWSICTALSYFYMVCTLFLYFGTSKNIMFVCRKLITYKFDKPDNYCTFFNCL